MNHREIIGKFLTFKGGYVRRFVACLSCWICYCNCIWRVSLHAEWRLRSKAFIKEKLGRPDTGVGEKNLQLLERPCENMSWVSVFDDSLFIQISIRTKEFFCKASRWEEIDRRFWMIETVVQDKNMLCSCIINESNLHSPFLKTRASPICSH